MILFTGAAAVHGPHRLRQLAALPPLEGTRPHRVGRRVRPHLAGLF